MKRRVQFRSIVWFSGDIPWKLRPVVLLPSRVVRCERSVPQEEEEKEFNPIRLRFLRSRGIKLLVLIICYYHLKMRDVRSESV